MIQKIGWRFNKETKKFDVIVRCEGKEDLIWKSYASFATAEQQAGKRAAYLAGSGMRNTVYIGLIN